MFGSSYVYRQKVISCGWPADRQADPDWLTSSPELEPHRDHDGYVPVRTTSVPAAWSPMRWRRTLQIATSQPSR